MGMGFTFDDKNTKGIASSLADMREVVESDSRNAERIFPYLSGEDINESPTHAPRRFVINFEDFPLMRLTSGQSWFSLSDSIRLQQKRDGIVALDYPGPVASDWPQLLRIVEQRVKPERLNQNDEYGKKCWWKFLRTRPELFAAKRNLSRVLVTCTTSKFRMFCFVPCDLVIDKQNAVFVNESWGFFAVMSSRLHETWSTFFGSTLEDRLVYTPSDCFDTFPFPEDYDRLATLEEAGRCFYEFRAALMIRKNEGLTDTYNRFHQLEEQSPEIIRLRDLHDAMDRAVLDAYGWAQIRPVCEFFPEFDEDEEDEDTGSKRKKKKKYRYRWPEEIHDDVLARLLILNRERAVLQAEPTAAFEDEPPMPIVKRKSKASTEPKLF
jgi:hypothetical protein